jgi:hypothetical protein
VQRLAVEAAIALPHRLRRLRIRREIGDDIHQASITLGCAIISGSCLAVPSGRRHG